MNPLKNSKVAIFIMPRSSRSWEGSEALWITAAGWATAAKRKLGDAVVVTSDRFAAPKEVWNYPLTEEIAPVKRRYRYIPSFLKTLYNDLVTWKNLRHWNILKSLEYKKENVCFVWEKHDLFFGPGKALARKYGVPLISYVHAPVVWEAAKWGVNRYFWGRILERIEARNLKQADLVAVVSQEVKQKVIQMGINERKIIVSPMAVEPSLFSGKKNFQEKASLALEGKWIIGWTGSFRKFHGLDHVIKAFHRVQSKVPQSMLMLVGDGSERSNAQNLVKKLELTDKVIFTGRKKFLEIPGYIDLFDIAVVSARSATGFHYSPLKLREYMVAGKAVLAPNAGEIPETFQDEKDLKLFDPGDIESLEKGMLFLLQNEEKKEQIARNGKELILKTATWDLEVEKVLTFIKEKQWTKN